MGLSGSWQTCSGKSSGYNVPSRYPGAGVWRLRPPSTPVRNTGQRSSSKPVHAAGREGFQVQRRLDESFLRHQPVEPTTKNSQQLVVTLGRIARTRTEEVFHHQRSDGGERLDFLFNQIAIEKAQRPSFT